MDCSICQTTNPEDNAFCENCGTRIAPAPPPPPSCSCGAPLSEMDSEGFCGGCGRRLKRPDSDHIEMTLLEGFAGVSDRGLRHNRNEDRFALANSANVYAVVVCDGVSMSPNADAAAAAAVESAIGAINEDLTGEMSDVDLLTSAIKRAAESVTALANRRLEAPATTLVAAVAKNGTLTVGWIGDSRAYWFTPQGGKQITRDHSGQGDGKSANPHALARWVGADSSNLEPEIVQQTMNGAGMLLLCSDGLWNYANDLDEMTALVARANAPGASALAVSRDLVEFARGKGGHDNITAVILRHPISEEPSHGG